MLARAGLRPRRVAKAMLFAAAAAVGVAGTRPSQPAPLYLELDG